MGTARYAGRVDWQLHTQNHLQLYYSSLGPRDTLGMHHRDLALRTVTTYTLVVQAFGVGGERYIPTPDVLAAQALHGMAPSALQAQMSYQPSAPQQPIMAQ